MVFVRSEEGAIEKALGKQKSRGGREKGKGFFSGYEVFILHIKRPRIDSMNSRNRHRKSRWNALLGELKARKRKGLVRNVLGPTSVFEGE